MATGQTPEACTSQFLSTGTPNDDRFIDEAGKATTNSLLGGNDLAEMGDCNDTIYGGAGGDQLHGAHGNDNVYGETGDDRSSVCSPRGWCGKLYGGAGDDTVQGAGGQDQVDDSQAASDTDTLGGGDQNDELNSKDGDTRDNVNGGPGSDVCTKDTTEASVANCEYF
jgi:Ca2+-binding RTX toxin-like protein